MSGGAGSTRATPADAGPGAAPLPPERAAALAAVARRHLAASRRAVEGFFPAAAEPVAHTCRAMARRFHRGGRLLVRGAGAAASDARHVAVEFVHPVIVGKRALPALALGGDAEAELALLARAEDLLLVVDPGGGDAIAATLIGAARRRGLATIGVAGVDGPLAVAAPDHLFVVGEADPLVAQEVQETLYHVLWELVHVFLDRPELLA